MAGEWVEAHWPMLAFALGSFWGLLVWAKRMLLRDYVTTDQLDHHRDQICEKLDKFDMKNDAAHNRLEQHLLDHIDK